MGYIPAGQLDGLGEHAEIDQHDGLSNTRTLQSISLFLVWRVPRRGRPPACQAAERPHGKSGHRWVACHRT